MAMSDRVIYAGTADGLFHIDGRDGDFDASLIWFQGQGVMRAPVCQDVDDPRRLYAGTTRVGVFVSDDSGEHWHEGNHGVVYKDLWSIAQHPTTKRMFIGTSPAHVFVSDDHGESWEECARLHTLRSAKQWTGPVPPHISRMKDLGIHTGDPSIVFGAIEEGWCVRSLDGGATWEQISEGVDHDSHAIYVMPDDPATVVATGGKGIFRSTDQGAHWHRCTQGIEDCLYTPAHIVVHPSRPQTLLTAVTATGPGGWNRPEGPGASVVRSTDQGETWSKLPEALPEENRCVPRALVGDPEDPDLCYMGMTDGTVWASDDAGEHFRQIVTGLPSVHSLALISG
ncbi:MAG: hypothetical protein GEU73_08155 [Chloroflexi bacterium]|nr:hypothetical protein [Chloroflexota bacterium]